MIALVILLVLLNLFFYLPSLNFFFISDDFYFLSFNNVIDLISLKPGFYHYNPVFWFTIWVTKSLFGLHPLPFHLITILVHLLNVCSIFILGRLLFKDYKLAFLGSLIYSLFFSHYEVVYWITGLNTSLMVFFYILGFITFTRLISKITILRYSTFLLFFILAILSHEYAISLPIICFIYWFIFKKGKRKLSEVIKIFSFPTLILFSIIVIKLAQSSANLVVKIPTLFRFFISILKSFLYLFIPNPYLIDGLPKLLLVILGVFLIIFLIFKSYKSKINLFLLTWFLITTVIFSATSLPQARYFYLSSIPAIFLTLSILKRSNRFLYFWSLFIMGSGIFFLQEQKIYWQKGSDITKNILHELQTTTTALSTPGVTNINKTIYFINLPDSVNGPPWQAYLFRNGLENAIELFDGKNMKDIIYFRTIQNDNIVRDDPWLSTKQLTRMKRNKEIIFIYSKEKESIIKY